MQILRAPVFIVWCVLFILHQVLQKWLQKPIPFADDYLDNLLITPILLTFLIVERRVLFKRSSTYYLSPLEVTMATVLIALVCEILFPLLSPDFVTDWFDLIFYGAGSLVFYFFINFWPGRPG